MNPVEDYIFNTPSPEREIMDYLHHMFTSAGLKPKISYGIPMYYGNRWVCYLNKIKKGGIELAFTRGHEFTDPTGLLKSKGRKLIRGWEISSLEELNEVAVTRILESALALDGLTPVD